MLSSISSSLILIFIFFIPGHVVFTHSKHHSPSDHVKQFHTCLKQKITPSALISSIFLTPLNSSFNLILNSTAHNLRYTTSSNPKPSLIFLPLEEYHVQIAIKCAKSHGIHIRVRSGGNDFEGASFTESKQFDNASFIIVDLQHLRNINVNVEDNSVWVQTGSTLGQLYYHIAQKYPHHAVTAGHSSSLGVGGHIAGGAYGPLMRMFGLGVDHVLDARVISPSGSILDRASMGEDLFWAVRGAGANGFGIVTWWKIGLVPVPQNVTIFNVVKRLDLASAARLLHKWQQVADVVERELFIRAIVQKAGSKSVDVFFNSLYLGGARKLVALLRSKFPEVNVTRGQCNETSWVKGLMWTFGYKPSTAPEILLNGNPNFRQYFKAKSDFVREAIPQDGILGLLKKFISDDSGLMVWTPYGGRMGVVPESSTPFPHRNGVKFMIQYTSNWNDSTWESEAAHTKWIRKLYDYMAPYVSKNPREAYSGCRDFDLGMNTRENITYESSLGWGKAYYKENFHRLAKIKTEFDPENFFRHEQSIPTLSICSSEFEDNLTFVVKTLNPYM